MAQLQDAVDAGGWGVGGRGETGAVVKQNINTVLREMQDGNALIKTKVSCQEKSENKKCSFLEIKTKTKTRFPK